MSTIGIIAVVSLGGLFTGALLLAFRQGKRIAVLEKEAEYADKESEVLGKQLDVLSNRSPESVAERLSKGTF